VFLEEQTSTHKKEKLKKVQENKIGKAIASTIGWSYNSTEAGAPGNDQSLNNSSRFNAFPVGGRSEDGYFFNINPEGNGAHFWSSTEASSLSEAYSRSLYYSFSNLPEIFLVVSKRRGLSVRFVRDH